MLLMIDNERRLRRRFGGRRQADRSGLETFQCF
jgi:hypothetical protein